MSSNLALLSKSSRQRPGSGMSNDIKDILNFSRNRNKRSIPFRNKTSDSNETQRSGVLDYSLINTDKVSEQSDVKTAEKEGHKQKAPTDLDLMSTMMNRITELERTCRLQAKLLNDSTKQQKVLEEKLLLYRKQNDELTKNSKTSISGMTDGDKVKICDLEDRCNKLETQIDEMEEFLADYGLVWVGNNLSGDKALKARMNADGRDMWKPADSLNAASSTKNYQIDYNTIIKNVNELNFLAGDGVSSVQQTSLGAQLQPQNSVRLMLYSNGIVLFNGPFRPIEEPSTQMFIKDLTDGYFPSELQSRFPDGIMFDVIDKREVLYRPTDRKVFEGEGQVLGSALLPVDAVMSKVGDRTVLPAIEQFKSVETELPGKKLTMEQFLNKLPNSVIKQGQVVPIRNSISDILQDRENLSANGQVILVETDLVKELRLRLDQPNSKRPITPRHTGTTTLRITSENGDVTYVLKMKGSDKIGDVRNALDKQRQSSSKYELVSGIPLTLFSDNSATLSSCGLVPNCALRMRRVKE